MLSVIRIDVFFLIGRRSLPGGAFFSRRCATRVPIRSERLFAVVVVVAAVAGRRGGARRRCRGRPAGRAAAPVARPAALDLVDLRGGEAKTRRDIVGDDLDDRALLARLGLPAALLEPSTHDDPGALRHRPAHVLGELPPRDDVEEAGLLLPLLTLLVPPGAVDRDSEGD